MIKTFPFRLDIEKEYNNRMYSVNSNDLKTVKFTFVVTDNGIPLDLTGLTVRIAIRKPDKKAVWQDCTVTNAPKGEVEVILESQAYVKKGEHEAELMLYKGTDTVAITQKFHYRAAEGIMSDKSLKSETVLGPIEQKLNEVQEVVKDLRENGTGIDPEARQGVEEVTAALADTAKKSEVQSLVVNKAEKTYVDQQISNIGNASPKGTYATLSALQTAFPTGTTGIYVVQADGKWYFWNGTVWTAGGVYQSSGIASKSVSEQHLSFIKDETIRSSEVGFVNASITGNITIGGAYSNALGTNGKALVAPVSPNTTYKITKTVSDRFRVAVHDTQPILGQGVKRYIKDQYISDETTDTTFTFTTGENENYVIIYVSAVSLTPQVTIEPVDSFITFTKPISAPNIGKDSTGKNDPKNGHIFVENFRSETKNDSQIIQEAFDTANGKIVEFEAGRVYELNNTVVAKADKVRGIIGNNATLSMTVEDLPSLRYQGNKTTGSAIPLGGVNNTIEDKEMNAFVRDLRATSRTPYKSNGMEFVGLFSANIENCFAYKCKNGMLFPGMNRNINISTIHLYDNAESGILFKNANLHQLNINGVHVSYDLNGIHFIDSNIANVQINGCDIENATADGYTVPLSLIRFETTANGTSLYEVVIITGSTIQDHVTNNASLINVNVKPDEMHELLIGNNLIGNASVNPVRLKNVNGVSVNNCSIVGYPHANYEYSFSKSIVIEGLSKFIRINDNHLAKPIEYGNATITKMMVIDNMLEGFTMQDSNDGNILIRGNF